VWVQPTLTTRTVLDWAWATLPLDQAETLARWILGYDTCCIARALHISPKAADQLLRVALDRVTMRFGSLPM